MAPAVVSAISSIAPYRLSHTVPPFRHSLCLALFILFIFLYFLFLFIFAFSGAPCVCSICRQLSARARSCTTLKRPPPRTALCPCPNVRATRRAHLIDVPCRASPPPPSAAAAPAPVPRSEIVGAGGATSRMRRGGGGRRREPRRPRRCASKRSP